MQIPDSLWAYGSLTGRERIRRRAKRLASQAKPAKSLLGGFDRKADRRRRGLFCRRKRNTNAKAATVETAIPAQASVRAACGARHRSGPAPRAAFRESSAVPALTRAPSASGRRDPLPGSAQDAFERRRRHAGHGRRVRAHDRRDHAGLAARLRTPVARQHLVQHAPKAKMSLRASASLPCSCSGDMYCSVPRICPSLVSAWSGSRRAAAASTDALIFASPKSSSLTPDLGHQDVGRLQIAVDDAFAVRGIQRIGNLDGVLQRLIERQRPFERLALDVLHHQVVRADVVELADVGMIQRGDRARLALEAFAELALWIP